MMWTKNFALLKFLVIILCSVHLSESRQLIDNNYDKVVFTFVHGKSPQNHTSYYVNDLNSLLKHKKFQLNRKTVFYIHGWAESFESEYVYLVTRAYIERNDHNIVIVDWGHYSVGGYFSTIPKNTKIAKLIGKNLADLFKSGLNIQKFHCVGHSFGAHICGIMSREVTRVSAGKFKLKRITGLDPAGPGYYPPISEKPLSPKDADFVDVIHTDTIWVGTNQTEGHVDFFTNFGQVQPGCTNLSINSFRDFTNNFCSHFNSVRYWSESLNPHFKHGYPALKCNNYHDFKKGNCDRNPRNYMGYDVNPNIPGIFYLELKTQQIIDGAPLNKQIISNIKDRVKDLIGI